MRNIFGLVSLVALLSACSEIPGEAYFNRGDPESLMDVSSEVVNLSISSPSALSRIEEILAEDPPSRVELSCARTDKLCNKALDMFDQQGIPVEMVDNGSGVALIYQRVTARDCENRYIDNSINPYNLHPPTFGCSVAANMVQQVSDKRQFVSPSLLDFQDGSKAVQNYRNYLKPTESKQGESKYMLEMDGGSNASSGSFK